MKKFKVKINNKSYEVEVEEMSSQISDNSQIKKVEETAAPKPEPGNVEGEEILAPLPGTISIEVNEGDTVSAGETIFILEAMKMENEIASTVSGTVKAIYVSNGDSVDTGDLLAVVG